MMPIDTSDIFGLDTFDVETLPPSPMRDVENSLGEMPQLLDASRLLKSTSGIQDGAIRYFRRSHAWMVVVDATTADSATTIGQRVQRSLVGKRNLTAADPFMHDKRLFIVYDHGSIELPPAEEDSEIRAKARGAKALQRENEAAIPILRHIIDAGGIISHAPHATMKRLVQRGILNSPKRGQFRITDEGLVFYKKHSSGVQENPRTDSMTTEKQIGSSGTLYFDESGDHGGYTQPHVLVRGVGHLTIRSEERRHGAIATSAPYVVQLEARRGSTLIASYDGNLWKLASGLGGTEVARVRVVLEAWTKAKGPYLHPSQNPEDPSASSAKHTMIVAQRLARGES